MSQSFRLGLFVLATLIILSTSVFLIGRQESKFGSSYRVRSEFANVAGLNEGADVRVGGIRKGTVRSIQLPKSSDGKVTVSMDLAKDTRVIVKQDSVATIQSEGLLGDKYVDVSFGSVEADQLKDNQTIESQPPLDISDLFQKANQILDTSQGALENIQGATDNMNRITHKINSGQGTIGKLVNDTALYQQATAGVSAIQDDATALQHNFLLRGFFKDRGYTNPAEVQQHALSELPKQEPIKRFFFNAKTLFDRSDSSKLRNQKDLGSAGDFLHSQSYGFAVIVCSMGPTGDSQKELALSEARSFVVRQYLVDKFPLDDTRLKTLGLGKSATGNEDGTIELLIYASDPKSQRMPPAKQQAPIIKTGAKGPVE